MGLGKVVPKKRKFPKGTWNQQRLIGRWGTRGRESGRGNENREMELCLFCKGADVDNSTKECPTYFRVVVPLGVLGVSVPKDIRR